jgi:hypothetical protein
VVKRTLLVPIAIAALASALEYGSACREAPKEPITLDGNFVTVDNRTKQEWRNVEVWLNHSYRATASSVPAGSRYQAPLAVFVDGYARRFDFNRMQIRDVRVVATQADGTPLQIEKSFQEIGLEHTLGGAVGKKH